MRELPVPRHVETLPLDFERKRSPRLGFVKVHRIAIKAASLLTAAWLGLGHDEIARADVAQEMQRHAEEEAVLHLVANTDPTRLDPETLRTAIERELGRSVALVPSVKDGDEDVLWVVDLCRSGDPCTTAAVRVGYRGARGAYSERILELPRTTGDQVEAIALLAKNLTRDEASELAKSLGKEPPKTPESPPPPPALLPPVTAPGATEAPLPAAASWASNCPYPAGHRRGIHLDFVPRLGTSSWQGMDTVNAVSINVLVGRTAGLVGVEAGGLVNVESSFVCGAQAAGIVNIVRGPIVGVQAAGIVNVGGPTYGVRGAGIANIGTNTRGADLAGIANVGDDVLGLQMAGVANVAKSVKGAQIGLVNVARAEVRGVQVGLLNISEDADVAVGLLSLVRNGRSRLDVWGTETGLTVAAFKHGGKRFHNLYGLGVQLTEGRIAPMLGYGLHFPLSERLAMDLDFLWHLLLQKNGSTVSTPTQLSTTRFTLSVRLFDGFHVFAGPTINSAVYPTGSAEKDLSPYGSLVAGSGANRIWPGISAGVEVH